MKICTVVVTYNRYELLKECLDSLLNQTYKTDILIVNNASTDGTDGKIKEDGYLNNENLIYKKPLSILKIEFDMAFFNAIKPV